MCRIGKYIPDVSDKERRASNLWGVADVQREEGVPRQMSSHTQREEGDG
jgi:hypothetical protein